MKTKLLILIGLIILNIGLMTFSFSVYQKDSDVLIIVLCSIINITSIVACLPIRLNNSRKRN